MLFMKMVFTCLLAGFVGFFIGIVVSLADDFRPGFKGRERAFAVVFWGIVGLLAMTGLAGLWDIWF